MKLKSFLVLSVFAFSVLLASCGAKVQNDSNKQVEELQSQVAELKEQVKNQQGQNTQTQNQQQNQVPQTQAYSQNPQYGQQGNQQGQAQIPQTGNSNTGITMDEAKRIATSNAGLDANSVTYIKTIQDYDNGFMKWEIDFVANGTKYEYDISASNGTILKAEREGVAYGGVVPPAGGQQNMGGQGIDVEQAKSIAVQHAGFAMSNVTFVKQSYDFDDGIAKWEIEFVNGTNKYEYEIAASNGSVYKYKVESIYND